MGRRDRLRAAVRSAGERQSQGDGCRCPLHTKPGASHRARTSGDKPSGKRGFAVGRAVVVPLRHVPARIDVIVFLERPARVACKVEGVAIKSHGDQAD